MDSAGMPMVLLHRTFCRKSVTPRTKGPPNRLMMHSVTRHYRPRENLSHRRTPSSLSWGLSSGASPSSVSYVLNICDTQQGSSHSSHTDIVARGTSARQAPYRSRRAWLRCLSGLVHFVTVRPKTPGNTRQPARHSSSFLPDVLSMHSDIRFRQQRNLTLRPKTRQPTSVLGHESERQSLSIHRWCCEGCTQRIFSSTGAQCPACHALG